MIGTSSDAVVLSQSLAAEYPNQLQLVLGFLDKHLILSLNLFFCFFLIAFTTVTERVNSFLFNSISFKRFIVWYLWKIVNISNIYSKEEYLSNWQLQVLIQFILNAFDFISIVYFSYSLIIIKFFCYLLNETYLSS